MSISSKGTQLKYFRVIILIPNDTLNHFGNLLETVNTYAKETFFKPKSIFLKYIDNSPAKTVMLVNSMFLSDLNSTVYSFDYALNTDPKFLFPR